MDVRPEQLLEQAKERFGLEDYYGVIHLLDELMSRGRAYADAFNLMGLSYQLIDQPDKALRAFDKALELNPHYVEAHIHRGVVLAHLGRETEAQREFERARETGTARADGLASHHAARLANLHADLGEAYVEAGQTPLAIVQYEKALELGPTFHDLRYRLGQLLLESGRSLEAREAFEAVMRARPGSPEAKGSFGLACLMTGDPHTARSTWRDLLREHPNDPRAKAYLAMLDRGDQG